MIEYCEVEDIHYVESKLNPSDLSTRGTCKVKDLGPNSFHQIGPVFLSYPRGEWPVHRNFDSKLWRFNPMLTQGGRSKIFKNILM